MVFSGDTQVVEQVEQRSDMAVVVDHHRQGRLPLARSWSASGLRKCMVVHPGTAGNILAPLLMKTWPREFLCRRWFLGFGHGPASRSGCLPDRLWRSSTLPESKSGPGGIVLRGNRRCRAGRLSAWWDSPVRLPPLSRLLKNCRTQTEKFVQIGPGNFAELAGEASQRFEQFTVFFLQTDVEARHADFAQPVDALAGR